ncbi:putative zinc ribbon protein [Diaminobutyricimonas aerilata]|uniref:Putative zinc ribbon protein n=1 Tax=Diaminobutyricimonas aerilata TaxID=1162967 RepID=A0A2M9CF63_9MICO|nr:zinc-ribbon domain-containing protein [Diaminobutyricimonas aerilata]PJJ70507.1 putative zinc ribbon protein [Diaminobutyricimonas aerilata]
MPESIERWWERRRFSRGTETPYPIGTYRTEWASYPVLVRQYHPDLNHGITLTQIPPAAEVYLQWQCEAGHIFVATPSEQRDRPGRERRRSSWCPVCSEVARDRPVPARPAPAAAAPSATAAPPQKVRSRSTKTRPARELCTRTPALPVGEPFASTCAPRVASAAEADLRAGLEARLMGVSPLNAVRLARPFFDHLEAWPDVLLPELRVALEYDTTGRHGLEHVGRREAADRRKDRALRSAGWEVIRIRTGRLPKLGPHDLTVAGLSRATYAQLLDELRIIRGALFVDAYLR